MKPASIHAALFATVVAVTLGACGVTSKPHVTRGEFTEKCEIKMSQQPSHAVYYDNDGNVVTYVFNGTQTALVEDMSKTKKNRLCQANPNGPGPCNPPVPGYCARSYGGFSVCVPC